jgi:hypothetical protein
MRKRPIFPKESAGGEIDCISAANPCVRVHECKYKVDGITKYIENYDFKFDNVSLLFIGRVSMREKILLLCMTALLRIN